MATPIALAYESHCKEVGIAPTNAVAAALVAAVDEGSFTLRGHPIGIRGLRAALCTLEDYLSSTSGGATVPSPLCAITLSHCYLGDDGCKELCESVQRILVLQQRKEEFSLRHIDLSGNGIRDAAPIAKLIGNPLVLSSIEHVNLEWNKFGNAVPSFALLATRLTSCSRLMTLNLANNILSSACLDHIVEIVTHAAGPLQKMSVAWNALGVSAGTALLDALQSNNSLRTLDITGNSVPSNDAAALATRLATNERSSAEQAAARISAEQAARREAQLANDLQSAIEGQRQAETDLRVHQRENESLKAQLRSAEERVNRIREDADRRIAALEESQDRALRTAADARQQASEQSRIASARVAEAVAQADEARLGSQAAVERLRNETVGLHEKIALMEREMQHRLAASSAVEASLTVANDELKAARLDVGRLQNQLINAESQRTTAEARATRLATDRDELTAQLAAVTAELSAIQSRLRDAEDALKAESSRRSRDLLEAERKCTAASQETEALRERYNRLEVESKATLDRLLADAAGDASTLRARLTAVAAERDELKAALADLRAQHNQETMRLKADLSATQSDVARAEAARRAAEEHAAAAQRDAASRMEEHSRRFALALEEVRLSLSSPQRTAEARVTELEQQLQQTTERCRRLESKLKAQSKNLETSIIRGVRSALQSGGGAAEAEGDVS